VRKRGEQPGLDTPIVHAVNDDNSLLVFLPTSWQLKKTLFFFFTDFIFINISGLANALNYPPEEYGRKTKTQRNRRGLTQVVEHVV